MGLGSSREGRGGGRRELVKSTHCTVMEMVNYLAAQTADRKTGKRLSKVSSPGITEIIRI